jgi:Domain of unknown function (DUF4157)
VEKTVQTLGEQLAADARRLSRRYQAAAARPGPLRPLIERNAALAASAERFERREAVPGPSRSPLAVAAFPAEGGELFGVPAGLAGTQGHRTGPASWQPAAAPARPSRPELADPGTPAPAPLRDQLRPALGPGVDLARVHEGTRADAYARSLEADAVTVGPDIYFRSGALGPQSPAGLGLLAHELSHVAEGVRPDAGEARARPQGAQQEEERARAVERTLTRPPISPLAAQAHVPPVLSAASVPAAPAPAAAAPAGAGAPAPMRAATDRPAAGQAPGGPDLDQFRQRLFRDVMSQLRVEFERGA